MKPGDVFWIEDIVGGMTIKHPHIVLTHPEPWMGKERKGEPAVAVVNISTVHTERHDKTTVIAAGVHPSVTDKSYVVYSRANFEFVSDIRAKKGYARADTPLSPVLFKKVFDGLFKEGGLTPEDMKACCSLRVSINPGEVRILSGVP